MTDKRSAASRRLGSKTLTLLDEIEQNLGYLDGYRDRDRSLRERLEALAEASRRDASLPITNLHPELILWLRADTDRRATFFEDIFYGFGVELSDGNASVSSCSLVDWDASIRHALSMWEKHRAASAECRDVNGAASRAR